MKLFFACLFVTLPASALAQSDPRIRAADANEFLLKARTAAQSFADQETALLDGFRPIGPELPAMGRHWLNQEYANLGYVDPARPAFLLYVTLDSVPKLAGVGYALALQPGEKLPVFPAPAWHEHSGSVEDETYAVTHHFSDDATRFRLVAIHVWLDLMPPDTFAAENWSLPFYRNAVEPPGEPSIEAARVLALTHGGAAYYREVLRRHASLEDRAAANVGTILEKYAATAAAWAAAENRTVAQLVTDYHEMWKQLEAAVPSPQLDALRRIKHAWASLHH